MITPRAHHTLSRANISKNVLKVLYRLKKAGFASYLVGGCVRDLLLNLHPKDFDVVTNALPDEICALFVNSRIIGRRFRLVHIRYGNEIIEVATFRKASAKKNPRHHYNEAGMLLRNNVFGSIAEDALRRDFTINALFYNIRDFSVVDYCNGMHDLKHKLLRMIGDPWQRYHEDPVRILRVVRLAAKLSFNVEAKSKEPIKQLVGLLQNVPPARIYDEILKWFVSGKSYKAFLLMQEYGVFAVLFPQTESYLAGKGDDFLHKFLRVSFISTDERIAKILPLNPAFLFAVLLWWPLQQQLKEYQAQNERFFSALHRAMDDVIKRQLEHMAIPRRITAMVKVIWVLQYRFSQQKGARVKYIIRHPRFRAAYDFLLLRSAAGEKIDALINWWNKRK